MGEVIHVLRPLKIDVHSGEILEFENLNVKIVVDFSDKEIAKIRIFENEIELKLHDLKPGDRATINLQNKAEFY